LPKHKTKKKGKTDKGGGPVVKELKKKEGQSTKKPPTHPNTRGRRRGGQGGGKRRANFKEYLRKRRKSRIHGIPKMEEKKGRHPVGPGDALVEKKPGNSRSHESKLNTAKTPPQNRVQLVK